MIDYFALALTHALLAIAIFRLVGREDLDRDPADAERGDGGAVNVVVGQKGEA